MTTVFRAALSGIRLRNSLAYSQTFGGPTVQRCRNALCWNSPAIIPRRFTSSNRTTPRGSGKGIQDRGPVTWTMLAVCLVLGGIGIYFVRKLKDKKQKELDDSLAQHRGSIGKALLGGPWELVNYDGQLVSWRDYVGKWIIIYFGFTHCPDICPEELEKLSNVINALNSDPSMPKVHPLFFTVDPYRDTPEKIKEYCLEYSPELVGFSGSVEQVAKVCKMFRVYFSEGPKMDDDYIVDHSIIMYLMNPQGEYVEHYSRETPEKRMLIKVRKQIQAYEASKDS